MQVLMLFAVHSQENGCPRQCKDSKQGPHIPKLAVQEIFTARKPFALDSGAYDLFDKTALFAVILHDMITP